MIISHKYRFIYFAIPKTGTHAIRRGIRPYLDKDDWEQVELFESKRLPIPAFENVNHGHITAQEIEGHLSPEIWKGYYKFSFVRHPLERFVSTCFYRFGKQQIFQRNPSAYMKLLFQTPQELDHLLFRPQSHFVLDKQGISVLNFTGNFSHLQQGFDQLCKQFGWEPRTLERPNSTNHHRYQVYYDQELTELVQEHFRDDLSLYHTLNP